MPSSSSAKRSHFKVRVSVINTGEGTEHHASAFDKARLHINTVRTYEMSVRQLDSKVWQLIEPTAVSAEGRRYFPEDIYGALDPFFVDEVEVVQDRWRKGQESGTCSLRVQLANAKITLGENVYKSLKPLFSEIVLTFAIEENRGLLHLQPQLNKLLSLCMQSELITSIKPIGENKSALVMRLIALSKTLKEVTPKAVSKNIIVTFAPQGIGKKVKNLVEKTEILKTSTNSLETDILPVDDIHAMGTIKEVQDYLDKIELSSINRSSFIYSKIIREEYLSSLLIELGRVYFKGGESELAKLFERSKNDKELSKQWIKLIGELCKNINRASNDSYSVVATRFVAFQYALLLTWELSTFIETLENYPEKGRLKTYGLCIENPKSDLAMKRHLFLDPELEEDILFTRGKLEQFQTGGSFNGLFNYMRQKLTRLEKGFSLQPFDKPNTVLEDYAFASALSEGHRDWTEADKAYEEATKEMRSEHKTQAFQKRVGASTGTISMASPTT